MTIPVAQAGSDQVYNYSTLPKLVTLSGAATNPPITSYEWTMLSVPDGSSANVGANGDFTNGVASIQNPQFTCDVFGCYVLQLRARNADGWSLPAIDRELAQTGVFIKTSAFALLIPNVYLYRYDHALNATLLDLEVALASHGSRHQLGGGDAISVAGLSGVLADAQDAGALQGRTVSSSAPSDGNALKWNAAGAGQWEPGTVGGGNNMIAAALNENTDQSSDVVVGSLGLAGSFLAPLNTNFVVTAYVTSAALTGTVTLYNVSDSAVVATLTFGASDLISTRKSTPAALPAGEKLYEVRMRVAGGGSSSDRVVCMWAGVEAATP